MILLKPVFIIAIVTVAMIGIMIPTSDAFITNQIPSITIGTIDLAGNHIAMGMGPNAADNPSAFDSSGNMWVAEPQNNRVVKYPADNLGTSQGYYTVALGQYNIGTNVENAKRILNEKLTLPPGYSLIWSGQFEYMERAKERLKLVVPLTLVIIFVLLYLNFQHLAETILVMLSLPLALIGGVWVLYYLQYELSVAVAVGFIALAGVAAEIGVLVLVYCNQEFENRLANGSIQKNSDVLKVVFDGTSSRIRPIMMTVISTIGGLIPIMIGTGTGTEVMKRIAAPMVGGMVSATLLNLIVLPALYAMVLQFRFSQRGPVIENGYSDKRELTPTP